MGQLSFSFGGVTIKANGLVAFLLVVLGLTNHSQAEHLLLIATQLSTHLR